MNMTYTIMSKRKLLKLVQEKHVRGWDDPRMPTISAMRRRGYPAAAIRDFCDRIGVTKNQNMIEIGLLEACVREDLNLHSQRVMGVMRPLKVVLTNYPEGQSEELTAVNNPEDETMGTRKGRFSGVLNTEKDDLMEEPSKGFSRLSPGREVRLRYAYFIKCDEVIKDAQGNIVELHCTYAPAT